MRPPWVGAEACGLLAMGRSGVVFTRCASVALLTATAPGVIPGSLCHRPLYAYSPSPERGIRDFEDQHPGSPLHGAHKYCHNGA